METNVFDGGKKWNNKILMLIYLLCPVVLYFFIFISFEMWTSYPSYVNRYYGLAIGCSTAVLIHISFAIVGIFKPYIAIEARRIADFFFDIKVSPKYAFSQAFVSIKEDGMWLHVLLLSTIVCIILSYIGFTFLFELYNIVV